MLMLSDFYFSKQLWSVGCGSGGCDARNEQYFGGPDKKRSMEHKWKTLISCIEYGVKYTGRNITKNHGRPYLLSSSY